MTSSVSDIKDFTKLSKLPGKLLKSTDFDDKVVYMFPQLKIKGRVNDRLWNIYVVLEQKNGGYIDFDKDYLDMSVERFDKLDVRAFYITIYGTVNGKKTTSKPTYTTSKNVGKKNETNPLTQALKTAYSHWTKKKDSITETDKQLPMLVNNLDDYPLNWDNKPYYVQWKYDGIRAIYYFKEFPPQNESDIASYSRNRKDFPNKFNQIKRDILTLYNCHSELFNKDFRFDGEYYIDGQSLQNISGTVRTSKATDLDDKIVYMVYDMFEAGNPKKYDVPFAERYELLKKIFQGCKTKAVLLAPTEKINNQMRIDIKYKDALEKGYEGIIVRDKDAPYEFSVSGYRSKNVLRRKPTESAEFEIVNWKTGKGKYADLVIFTAKTRDGLTFNVDPKWDDEKRKAFTKQLSQIEANGKTNFENDFKGTMATVEYQDISDKGIPIRAKLVAFRDYE